MSKEITADYASHYVVVKEFAKSINQYGNVVYTGVVKDSETISFKPGQKNITIELTKNKTETLQRVQQLKPIYEKMGYSFPSNMTTFLGGSNSSGYTINLAAKEPYNACGFAKRFPVFTICIEERHDIGSLA